MSQSSPAQARPWTQADMHTLTALSERGVSSKLIALLLSRSVRAVSAKRRALSLPAFVSLTSDQLHTDGWLPVEVDILRKVVQAHRVDSTRPLHRNRLESVAQDLCRPFPMVLSALRDLGFSDCLPASVLHLLSSGVSAQPTADQPTPEPEQQSPKPDQSVPEQQTSAPTAPTLPPSNLEPFIPPAHSSVPRMMTSSAPTRVRLKPPVSHGESEFERLFPGSKEVTITSLVTGISRTHLIPAPETPTVPGSETPSVHAPVTDSTPPVVTASEPTTGSDTADVQVPPVVLSAVRSLVSSGVSDEVIAQATGIDTATVESLIKQHGFKLVRGVNNEAWSVFEIAYLESQLDGVSTVEVSDVEVFASGLNRHVKSVVMQVRKLGVEVNKVTSVLADSDYTAIGQLLNLGWSVERCSIMLNIDKDIILRVVEECTIPSRLVPWSEEEVSTLKGIFGNATHEDLTSALPLRPLPAILSKAESLNL